VAQGHYQVEFVVIVALIGNMLGAMITWRLEMSAARNSCRRSFAGEKQKVLNILYKE
jgi:membrane protein YqaA with SNARE-associated domain